MEHVITLTLISSQLINLLGYWPSIGQFLGNGPRFPVSWRPADISENYHSLIKGHGVVFYC